MPSIKIDSWHPFALRFPLMEGEEFESLKDSIRKLRRNTVPIIYRRLPDGTLQGIDGRNRYRACEELGIKCRADEEIIDDEEVLEYILAHNLYRRHMGPELRRSIVADLRAEGKSLRDIADIVGVSHSTVAADLEELEASGVKNLTPEEVAGKDGKTYTKRKRKASAPKEKPVKSIVLCPFCQHRKEIGRPLIENCDDCKILRKGEKAAKQTQERRDVAAGEDVMYDDAENIVPGALRAIFADEPLYLEAATAFDNAARIMEELEKSPGYLMGTGKMREVADKNVYWTMARSAAVKMRHMRPAEVHTVSDGCAGEKCKECQGRGYFINGELEPK